MQEWTKVRRKVLVEGASKRSVCREFGLGWETLERILSNPEPPGYRQSGARVKTKLGTYLGVIEEILAQDRTPSRHPRARGTGGSRRPGRRTGT